MIYIDDHIMDFDLRQALTEVSAQRREQALRYRHERDQRLSVAAYHLLQHALLTEYGIQQPPVLAYGTNGKPMLAEWPYIHFSLSHCREAAACVVSDKPVGIDIESIDHYDEAVAAQVMNSAELRKIHASPSPQMAFTRLWTMKESLYKLTGGDPGADILQLLAKSEQYDFDTILLPHCVCTVCQRKNLHNPD